MPESSGAKAMAINVRRSDRRTIIEFYSRQNNDRTEEGTDMGGKVMRKLNSMKRLAMGLYDGYIP
jgi:hypothetical protein